MKNISFFFNTLVIIFIILTPKYFHNDYTHLLDYIVILLITVNFFINRLRKHSFKELLLLSISQFVYCVITISSNSELYYKKSRIACFSGDEIFNIKVLNVLENIWLLSFLIILILETKFIYKSLQKKSDDSNQ